MNAFLSVRESLKYWRSTDPYHGTEVMVSPSPGVTLSGAARTESDIEHIHLSEFADENGCIELLVCDASLRSRTKKVRSRVVSTPLPPNSFYKVKPSAYACSPELLLCLYASRATLIETIALGCELCGGYSARNIPGDNKHDPITSIESIESFLKAARGLDGAKKCRRALRHIREGSASPRETDLYMMLCLPSKLGGFGLKNCLLNHKIDVYDWLGSKTYRKAVTPDIYWSKFKIAVEYESDEFHIDSNVSGISDSAKLRHTVDSVKRRTYEAMGITVITVTNGEFVVFDETARIAELLAKLMGKHGLCNAPRLFSRRTELHEWLKVPVLERKRFTGGPQKRIPNHVSRQTSRVGSVCGNRVRRKRRIRR